MGYLRIDSDRYEPKGGFGMMKLDRRARRHMERVEFCDGCSRVVTATDRSRKLVELAQIRAITGLGVLR